MLYFIYGESNKCFEKSAKLVDSMLLKRPDSEVFKISSENFSESKLDELIGSQSLFSKKYIVQMSRISESKEGIECLIDKLEEVKKSDNVFVWVDPGVTKEILKKVEKFAEKVQEFSAADNKNKKSDSFNVFSLTDALGERDVKKLWPLYLFAVKDIPVEEIHGVLWWQVKTMVMASQTNSAEEAGLKPFVYSKAKKYSKNFSKEELENLPNKMIEVYHESRRGGADLETRLEKLILEI
jgi:DNA polymerase III delta subunit